MDTLLVKPLDAARPPRAQSPLQRALQNFDELPDTARVPGRVVDALYSISPATRWRRIKAGRLPKPRRDGFVVGELRALLRG